ncbi:hypothetical protein [Ferrovibrio sp.]|uniref:PGAP1-like alpha/beta domain-containing protein n=1 Tax=Ferrovibrio sp. TaxID=1917215 RepID=UPI00311F85BE
MTHPYHPIIYVRGFAMSGGEVEDTVADPFMGFNLGSTKVRLRWTGRLDRHYFESPLIRLMKEHHYSDTYLDGENWDRHGRLPDRPVFIYRYYDTVSEAFGDGSQGSPIEHFARGLHDLILRVRDLRCGNDAARRAAFRVYLVAHSMGGLIVRCLLQNDTVGSRESKQAVDKVFTYATPHNGIDAALIGNVPSFLSRDWIDNFNRSRMRKYLQLRDGDPASSLGGKFDPDRFFSLVGTNARDYTAAMGLSKALAGEMSDGLVRIDNASIVGPPPGQPDGPLRPGPRAYVHRSHSGHYGIVNSEEGYQNLVRFLFGDVRVDAHIEVDDITLPPRLQQIKDKEKRRVRASYHFEAVAQIRRSLWDLSRRVATEHSTVFRKYGELFPDRADPEDEPRQGHDKPVLFTLFMNSGLRLPGRDSIGFALDFGVLVPEYEVDRALWLDDHYAGGYIFRDKINFEVFGPWQDRRWSALYGFDSEAANGVTREAPGFPFEDAAGRGLRFEIPIVKESRPGIRAKLVLTGRSWA